MARMGLDTVELVFAIEKHFDIEIPDEVAAGLVSVGLVHEFILQELQRLGRTPRAPQQLLDELILLVSKHSGVEAVRIHSETRFVDDLRMD
jgi:acyl carrier protein